MPDDLKKLAIPLGILIPILVACAGAYGWARSELVWASDFTATIQTIQAAQKGIEIRGLQREAKKSEIEIIKLEAKRTMAPDRFDAVDKATLDAHRNNIQELKDEIKEIKRGTK